MTDFKRMQELASKIVSTVKEKDASYGSSWRRRGGVGAFMMLARKWDRIENIVKGVGWDVFAALGENKGDVRDDIDDLIGYLLLVREHTSQPQEATPNPSENAQGAPEGWSNEGYYGDLTCLWKCKSCGHTTRAVLPPLPCPGCHRTGAT